MDHDSCRLNMREQVGLAEWENGTGLAFLRAADNLVHLRRIFGILE